MDASGRLPPAQPRVRERQVHVSTPEQMDETIRKIAEQRERMAELEGFLASRRDRDAA